MGAVETGTAAIEVIATTMSGSIKDQRMVGRIEPVFRSIGDTRVNVHRCDSHEEARSVTHTLVSTGSRLLVSAGGAGTFNAVLEGAHISGSVPSDLRLAFLRKGSADLVGKALGIPKDLEAAARVIVEGMSTDRYIGADILAVEADDPKGNPQLAHVIGFGGMGLFGEIPRFTETRFTKYYKGILGTLFGDLGPFYVGLAGAATYWQARHIARRVPRMSLTMDDETQGPSDLVAVIVMNGDLGRGFPLGRGLAFSSGDFRVIAISYRGLHRIVGQMNACRTGRILDDPAKHGAVVRNVTRLSVIPANNKVSMVNVDGMRMFTSGPVQLRLSGRVSLISARETEKADAPLHKASV